MKMINRIVTSMTVGYAVMSGAMAATPVSEMVDSCKAAAAMEYGSDNSPAQVRFVSVGSDRSTGNREVRLRVYPAAGTSFVAVCDLDRQSGKLVSLLPGTRLDREVMIAAGQH